MAKAKTHHAIPGSHKAAHAEASKIAAKFGLNQTRGKTTLHAEDVSVRVGGGPI